MAATTATTASTVALVEMGDTVIDEEPFSFMGQVVVTTTVTGIPAPDERVRGNVLFHAEPDAEPDGIVAADAID